MHALSTTIMSSLGSQQTLSIVDLHDECPIVFWQDLSYLPNHHAKEGIDSTTGNFYTTTLNSESRVCRVRYWIAFWRFGRKGPDGLFVDSSRGA